MSTDWQKLLTQTIIIITAFQQMMSVGFAQIGLIVFNPMDFVAGGDENTHGCSVRMWS